MATLTVAASHYDATIYDATSTGDYFDIDSGNVMLEVANSGSGSIDITLYGVGNLIIGASNSPSPLTVNVDEPIIVGPINPNRAKTTTGYASSRLDYSEHVGVKVRVWEA
jgi:hypothetical protein